MKPGAGIIHHTEGVDLLPANIELSGLEVTLVNTMSRETILREYLKTVQADYDVILLDCCPSCDETIIKTLDKDRTKAYGDTLLNSMAVLKNGNTQGVSLATIFNSILLWELANGMGFRSCELHFYMVK